MADWITAARIQKTAPIFSLLPASLNQQYWSYCLAGIIVGVFAIAYSLKLGPLFFPLDDAYIILHNVQVLHAGYDANYVQSTALEGTTSPIFLWLVFLFSFLFKPVYADVVVSGLASYLYAIGLLRLAFYYRASLWQAWSLLLVGITVAYTPLQLLNGLETGLALAAITWVLVFATKINEKKHFLACNFLCGWLPFLRPELIIFSGLLLIWQIINFWREAKNNFIKQTALATGIMLLAAVPWLLWNFLSLATFYPQTMVAKQLFFAQSHWLLQQKLSKALIGLKLFFISFNTLGCWLLLGLLLITPMGRVILFFIILMLGVFIWNLPSALFFNYQRYLYIFIPLLLYGAVSCLQHPQRLWRYIANFALLITLVVSLAFFSPRWQFYLELRHYYAQELPALANWVKQHVPANKVIAVHDAGYLSYATAYRLTDIVGVKSPQNIANHRKYTYPSGGQLRAKAIAEILQQNQASYLIVTAEWDNLFGIATGLQKLGWNLQTVYVSPNGYRVYQRK